MHNFDVAILGGGINGAGLAADLSAQGVKVLLLDKDDFASGASSASSKLIHGGLRYLENYEFKLVKESLLERKLLLTNASHLVSPITFNLPLTQSYSRSPFTLAIGLACYQALAGFKQSLPTIKLFPRLNKNLPLSLASSQFPAFKCFQYSDAQVDDARLVIHLLRQAQQQGAVIHNYCELQKADFNQEKQQWHLMTTKGEYRATQLVNATGSHVDNVNQILANPKDIKIKSIAGSHLVFKRPDFLNQAWLLQTSDKRVVFAIPWLQDFMLLGTTEFEVSESSSNKTLKCPQTDIDYLLAVWNQYFDFTLSETDIVESFCGIRPLLNSAKDNAELSKISRDFELIKQGDMNLLTLVGGKITSYRHTSEVMSQYLCKQLDMARDLDTQKMVLLGSHKKVSHQQLQALHQQKPFLSINLLERWRAQYGDLMLSLFNECQEDEIVPGVFKAELDYLIKYEWLSNIEDLLWRRTKLSLYLSDAEKISLKEYWHAHYGDH